MRMLTIVAIASFIALSGLASAQAQTAPIRGTWISLPLGSSSRSSDHQWCSLPHDV